MTASDHVRVVLEDVVPKLSGVYLCEVTVTNTFFAMAETANMTVIGELSGFEGGMGGGGVEGLVKGHRRENARQAQSWAFGACGSAGYSSD